MDFRKADPTYINFVPKTCVEAIDLFNRHKNLGLSTQMYPECFIHCARQLPDNELDMFHRYLISPEGDVERGGETPTVIDEALERERRQLLKEAEMRDSIEGLVVEEEEEEEEKRAEPEDEKSPESEDESLLIIEKNV